MRARYFFHIRMQLVELPWQFLRPASQSETKNPTFEPLGLTDSWRETDGKYRESNMS
jgi:hypothetical protein